MSANTQARYLMWLFFWRRFRTREERQRRGHPWVFVLAGWMVVGAVMAGDWLAVVVLLAIMLWLVVA